MDAERRRRASNQARGIFVWSIVAGVFIATPLVVVGLLVGLIASFWWLLFVGLALLVLCVVGVFAGLLIETGVAGQDVEASIQEIERKGWKPDQDDGHD